MSAGPLIPYHLPDLPHIKNRIARHRGGPVCPTCQDTGHACEDHPDQPWEGVHGPTAAHQEHGGIGIPCPDCCSPIPADGTRSITDAFVPDWMRVRQET